MGLNPATPNPIIPGLSPSTSTPSTTPRGISSTGTPSSSGAGTTSKPTLYFTMPGTSSPGFESSKFAGAEIQLSLWGGKITKQDIQAEMMRIAREFKERSDEAAEAVARAQNAEKNGQIIKQFAVDLAQSLGKIANAIKGAGGGES